MPSRFMLQNNNSLHSVGLRYYLGFSIIYTLQHYLLVLSLPTAVLISIMFILPISKFSSIFFIFFAITSDFLLCT